MQESQNQTIGKSRNWGRDSYLSPLDPASVDAVPAHIRPPLQIFLYRFLDSVIRRFERSLAVTPEPFARCGNLAKGTGARVRHMIALSAFSPSRLSAFSLTRFLAHPS